MNLQQLFQDFNPSKFVVHSCLLIFVAFFSLRLDNHIKWSYWWIFAPIWVWKALVILGATVGSYVWWRYPHFRLEGEAYIHYKAMLISLALHLILLMFELLVCDKLESGRHLWILVFIPLIFISIVSIAVCIWAVKHDRSFELELFCAVNVLQFIFLALRLDEFIGWSWEVVFVPLWIVMCLALVGVLYTIIFAGILLRTPEVNAQQRRSSFQTALGYTFLVIPVLIFQVLLANKLDEDIEISHTSVAIPLMVSFVTLILMSFNSKGGNKWWFGMRKDFCSFILSVCPLLQEYGNIAYHSERHRNGVELEQQSEKGGHVVRRADLFKPVLPIVSIELPD
ncbi:transmembrane protein 185B [Agrilus planipennis]|uniref:Transmembrane protein 185B n=1 Tax=Agrilus planipennis TaxID=224129 RepID=A0A1W4X8F3_AGRPL|nr:transmembrane protein 185B [Agrilus planipennis]